MQLTLRQKQMTLGIGSGVVGFYAAHWLIYSEASRFNKIVALLGGAAVLMTRPSRERTVAIGGVMAGAAAMYVTAAY